MGLGEARRGRQEADGQGRRRQGRASGASTPRRTDMENYWSSLVWQNGGDIISADHKTSLVGSDQATGGIQFLQDLIWKDKVMPDPAIADRLGDAFEQGKAAMEANGSWLVATHQAAGIDFGIAPLPKGPAGQATSINPTGAVVYKGTQEPGRRLGVREVPRQPGGPDQDHGAEGVDAGEQGGPRRPVRDVVRRAPRSSPTPSPTPTSSPRSRATTSGRPRSRPSSTRTSSSTRTRRPSRPSTDVMPQLDEILAGQ